MTRKNKKSKDLEFVAERVFLSLLLGSFILGAGFQYYVMTPSFDQKSYNKGYEDSKKEILSNNIVYTCSGRVYEISREIIGNNNIKVTLHCEL